MIGWSPAISAVLREIQAAAPPDAPVMLTGESGTGKEEAAREIYRLSARRGEFVPVNCAAFPEGLIEASCSGTNAARSPARTRST